MRNREVNKEIVQTEAQTKEVLKSLDWTVSLLPMPHPITLKKTDFYGIVRDDNQTLLASNLSKHYKLLQNGTILDLAKTFVNGFANQKMTVKDTFSIDGGATNNITIQAGSYDVTPGDTIIPQIILSNNHNGTGKMTAKATILRKWCDNGMCTVLAKFATVAISHKGDTKGKVIEAKNIIEQMTKAHAISENIFKQMTKIKFTEKDLLKILKKDDDQSTQKKNETEKILQYFRNADDGKTDRDTTWNGWNSYTRFTNHDSVQRIQSNSGNTASESRLHSVYSGRIAKKNQDIFEEIIAASNSWGMVEAMIAETEVKKIESVSVEDILAEMGA